MWSRSLHPTLLLRKKMADASRKTSAQLFGNRNAIASPLGVGARGTRNATQVQNLQTCGGLPGEPVLEFFERQLFVQLQLEHFFMPFDSERQRQSECHPRLWVEAFGGMKRQRRPAEHAF